MLSINREMYWYKKTETEGESSIVGKAKEVLKTQQRDIGQKRLKIENSERNSGRGYLTLRWTSTKKN